MKVYVRAPYEEACLAELNKLFDEVVYEPWTPRASAIMRTRCWSICWRCSRTPSSRSWTG